MGGQTGRVISIINFFALFFPGIALVFFPPFTQRGPSLIINFLYVKKMKNLKDPEVTTKEAKNQNTKSGR